MTTDPTPAGALPATPCERIPVIEAALFQLASGKSKAQVRYAEHWLSYHPGSVAWLERELNRCRALCPDVARGGNGERRPVAIGYPAGAPSRGRLG